MLAIAVCFCEYGLKDNRTCCCFLEVRGGLGPNRGSQACCHRSKVVASLIGKQDQGLWRRRAKTDPSSTCTGLSKLSFVGCHHKEWILSEWRDATCDLRQVSLSTQGYSGADASYMCMHWAARTCYHYPLLGYNANSGTSALIWSGQCNAAVSVLLVRSGLATAEELLLCLRFSFFWVWVAL